MYNIYIIQNTFLADDALVCSTEIFKNVKAL